MNQALVDNKVQADESKVLKNRIVKMQKDIEKSQKRLHDMQKKQSFLTEIKMQKARRAAELKKAKDE